MENVKTYFDWWSDIWIPLIGAIAIPLLVWILTRYYGADKFEERKEKKELRDNLNLLLSVLSTSLKPLLGLKNMYMNIQQILQKSLDKFSHNDLTTVGQCFYMKLSIQDVINPAKYSSCITINSNFVVDLLTIIQQIHIVNELVLHRNTILKDIGNCENLDAKNLRLLDFIKEEKSNIGKNIIHINKLLLDIKEFIEIIEDVGRKIKNLNLDKVEYDENMLNQFEIIKTELKSLGENKNIK